ncbi:hypothetical protein ACFVIL_29275 [Streptomyces sp. NPDC127159]|uniref:hypothetical protein n=1 Tax=unclassified Streptomyces TaxID=2593676 RepID=UPI0036411EB4
MTRPEPSHSPPPAVIAAGGVYLPANACRILWPVLQAHYREHVASGGDVYPVVQDALTAMRAAAHDHMSARGRDSRTSADITGALKGELIRTEQLAFRLGVSERHARRLAAQAGVTPASRNAWLPEDADHLVQTYRRP